MTGNVCSPDEASAYQSAMADPSLSLESTDASVLPCGAIAPTVVEVPCDIDSIEVTDRKAGLSVGADRPLRRDTEISRRERRALEGYDVLYEAVVDAVEDQPHENHADITVRARAQSTCGSGSHISVAARGAANRERIGGRLALGRLYAPAAAADRGWITDFWSGLRKNETVIDAITCGCRVDASPPTEVMRGLIRLYRQDTWELKIGFPSMIRRQRSRSAYRDFDGASTSTSTSASRVGRSSTTQTAEDRTDLGEGHAATTRTTTVRDGSGRGQRLTETEGITADDPEDGLTDVEAEGNDGPTFTLKHNGHSCNVTRRFNQIIAIQATLQQIMTAIRTSPIPKVGWDASMDTKILEGSLTAGLELKRRTDRPSQSERLVLVERNLWLEAEIKLIWFRAELNFGITCLATVGDDRFGFEVTVGGFFEASLSADGRIDTQRTAAIRLTADSSIGLTAVAQVCFSQCVGIRAEIVTGITARGAIRMTQSRPLTCRGEMKMNPLLVKVGTIENSQFVHQADSPYTIVEEQDIWSGNML